MKPKTKALPTGEQSAHADAVPGDVHFIREVTIRYKGPWRKRVQVCCPLELKPFLDGILQDDCREHLIAFYLDNANQVSAYSVVSVGVVNSSLVHPREVFQRAIFTGASSLILAHNHPSGSLEPSEEDRRVTETLFAAGKILGIRLLDHVIFTCDGVTSLRERGWLE